MLHDTHLHTLAGRITIHYILYVRRVTVGGVFGGGVAGVV